MIQADSRQLDNQAKHDERRDEPSSDARRERKSQRPHRDQDQEISRTPAPISAEEYELRDDGDMDDGGHPGGHGQAGGAVEQAASAERAEQDRRTEENDALARAEEQSEQRGEGIHATEDQRIVVPSLGGGRAEAVVVEGNEAQDSDASDDGKDQVAVDR